MVYSLSGIKLPLKTKIQHKTLSQLEHEFAVVVNYNTSTSTAVLDLPPGTYFFY
jgi:hypothetical protein